jgi:serine protease inhibitor
VGKRATFGSRNFSMSNFFNSLIIVDAIFFHGDWLFPFDATKTEPMKFHVDDDRTVDYPFGMKLSEALRMAHIEELGADVLGLPFRVVIKFLFLCKPYFYEQIW